MPGPVTPSASKGSIRPSLGRSIGVQQGLSVGIAIPLSIPGVQEWHDVELSPKFTDSGRMTPANASYIPIGAIDDLGSFSANLLQSTSGNRPLLVLNGNIQHACFDGSNDGLISAASLTRGPFTVVMVARNRGSVGVMWHRGVGFLGSDEEWCSNTMINSVYITRTGTGHVTRTLPFDLTDNLWRILAVRYDGMTVSYRINGAAVTLSDAAAALGTATFAAPISIGTATDGTFIANIDFASKVAYDSALSDGDCATLENYFNARFGIFGFSLTKNVMGVGNSWVFGFGSSQIGVNHMNQTADFLGPTYGAINNQGVNGQTITFYVDEPVTNMTASAVALYPLIQSGGVTNILVFLEGYNEMNLGGKTPEEAYANTVTYCAAWRVAAGANTLKIVVCTTPVTFNGGSSYSAMVRADTLNFDALADFEAHSVAIMADSADGLHPGNAGYGIMAGYLSTAIAGL